MEKLGRNGKSICTSFPVPIVEREKLEEVQEKYADKIVRFPGISFYILFNENLLDEEKLQAMIWEKRQKLEKIGQAVLLRKKEYAEYFQRQEMIKNQTVTKESWQEVQETLEKLEEEKKRLEKEIRDDSQSLEKLKKDHDELQAFIARAGMEIQRQRQKLEDFKQLKRDYDSYESNREVLEKCKKEEARYQENQKLARDRQRKLLEEKKTLEYSINMLGREEERLSEKYARYVAYENAEQNFHIDESLSADQMEARYEAITSVLSQELKDLEAQEKKVAGRFQRAMDDLEYQQKKYKLKPSQWQNVFYDRKEETHQEVILEDFQRKIQTKDLQWNEADKKAAVAQSRISELMKRIRSVCGMENPLPQNEIQGQDFAARRNQLLFQIKEEKKHADFLNGKVRSYEENLTALSEYNELIPAETEEWETISFDMEAAELRKFKGILIRDYNQRIRDTRQKKEELVQLLNKIVRMEAFQDDFYRKPLEQMLELSGDAGRVLIQLRTTVQSYDSLMEKLEVDISVVEREKERIVELMEDYVQEIHRNLGKIDHNSTITIREKPVKMLRIQIPDWEENAGLYHLRLEDFIKMDLHISNSYNLIVKISGSNAGGEGFLSAFVILSSLLYYMRKDDTDIFADRNEGKVLIMDNPFAQTNASHLLIPLMDMAKKTNTQLICLTGLGGDSIYNRFDNIYILNLIAASLRGGMQYLKAEHKRGKEPDELITARIEVGEQQELLF